MVNVTKYGVKFADDASKGVLGRWGGKAGQKASKASSAWASNLRKGVLGSAAIGGGAYGIGAAGDAYEAKKNAAETDNWLQQRDEILNDPHLSSEEKAQYLDNLPHPDEARKGGWMARLNNISITGAIMLVAFGYLGVRGLNMIGGMI